MDKIYVKNFTLPEMENWVESIGERRFRARQLFCHIYARRIRSWNECSDLGKMFRAQLEFGTHLDALVLKEKQEASDGTKKYLFELHDGHHIESVLIPDPPRNTLCISSQVGCALGCKFCLTGTMGLKRNLTSAEIVDQVCQVQHEAGSHQPITNIVFMGMGEPLANYDAMARSLKILMDPGGLAFSHRRITVSTAGLMPQLRLLGQESPVNLAISLHAADDAIRDELMPINRTYPLAELMAACREHPVAPRKRISFEYILIEGVNDHPSQARKLIKLLHGIRAKINLIPFNPFASSIYRQPTEERVLAFQEVLRKTHITTTIRKSRGSDISAACGQLAAKYERRS
jgi:23S rRNA (adenine2503-C2)-methyltransferase